jgi:hypothetical protein
MSTVRKAGFVVPAAAARRVGNTPRGAIERRRLHRRELRGLARRTLAHRRLWRRRGEHSVEVRHRRCRKSIGCRPAGRAPLGLGRPSRHRLGCREPALVPPLRRRAVLGASLARQRRHAGRPAAAAHRRRPRLRHRHARHDARLSGDAGDARSARDSERRRCRLRQRHPRHRHSQALASGRCSAATTMPKPSSWRARTPS